MIYLCFLIKDVQTRLLTLRKYILCGSKLNIYLNLNLFYNAQYYNFKKIK